jgi:hypothetical protein
MATQLEPIKEVLGELFGLLEAQETNSAAILQFLKDAGLATDEKLAPYLEQAGNASSVKWRAARMRMEFLLSPVQKQAAEPEARAEKVKGTEAGKAEPVAQPKSAKQIQEPNETKDAAVQAQALQGETQAARKSETKRPTREKPTGENLNAGNGAATSEKPDAEKQAASGDSAGTGPEDTKAKSTHP